MSAWAERLESAWRARAAGAPPPDWRDFLPAGACSPDELLCLLQIDVEFRAREGLPGLLQERYFEHVELDEAAQAELLRWECLQRRKHGRRVRAADYAASFPRLAAQQWPPRDCPRCGRKAPPPGEGETSLCPGCGVATHPAEGLLPPPPELLLDRRQYELLEAVGEGGMGEVYRTRDPGLGRDLALKVLKPRFAGSPHLEARFLREARITAALQHPNIVPVHNLGRLPDGRLFFSMKLVRGRTLEALLADGFPGWLGAFEQVCQAVGYAHGRGVVHRDLKPSNVMVGGFGEVQVMDWGLAAERPPTGPADDTPTPEGQTRAGAVMGTPAFMPPEQARGERADERSDVFALGAILCVALTGKPPFAEDALNRARAGDLAEAHARLEGCTADPELVRLCKECLAPDRAGRPADAGQVAARVAAHREGMERRARQAEVERALARAQAEEQARRFRLRLALVGAVSLFVIGALAAWGWAWQRQADADRATSQALSEARAIKGQADERPLDEVAWDRALDAAKHAEALARAGASPYLAGEAARLLAEAQREAKAAARDRRLLAALLEAKVPLRLQLSTDPDVPPGRAVVRPGAAREEAFAAAFRDWGLAIDTAPAEEAVEKLRARPPAVLREVVAALDERAVERWQEGRPGAGRLWAIASRLDGQGPSRELRVMFQGGRAGLAPSLLACALVGRAAPVPAPVPVHPDHRRLVQMAGLTDGPPPGLLAAALTAAGEQRLAERLLRDAAQARPQDVRAWYDLGLFLERPPGRWAEAVECYTAVRALRPDRGLLLAAALRAAGRREEAIALVSRRLIPDAPEDANRRVYLASVLYEAGHTPEALRAAEQATRRFPGEAGAHYILGLCRHATGQPQQALAAFRKAAELAPGHARAHVNIGALLKEQGDLPGAIAAARRAIAAEPNSADGHLALGDFLRVADEQEEALAPLRRAAELEPLSARAIAGQVPPLLQLGRYAEAASLARRALRLPPASHPVEAKDFRTRVLRQLYWAEQNLPLERRLPALAAGTEKPRNFVEQMTAARAMRCRKQWKAAAVLFDTDRLPPSYYFTAARCAALAATGDDAARMRGLALRWMRGALGAGGSAGEVKRWLADPAFGPVRDEGALAALPDAERQAWRKFWVDARAAAAPTPAAP